MRFIIHKEGGINQMLKSKSKRKFLSLLVAAMMTVGLSTSITAREMCIRDRIH